MNLSKRLITRRNALSMTAIGVTALPILGCNPEQDGESTAEKPVEKTKPAADPVDEKSGDTMQVEYLEVVSKDAAKCVEIYSAVHGVSFGEPEANLGGARIAKMANGSMIAVRGPMHDAEKEVTRAYLLVDDIKAAVASAEKAGAKIAVPPMELPGFGTCAIYFIGDIEAGLWQK